MLRTKVLLRNPGSKAKPRKGGNDPGFAAAQPARTSGASCWSFPSFRQILIGRGQSESMRSNMAEVFAVRWVS
jgi:hypothetical protein